MTLPRTPTRVLLGAMERAIGLLPGKKRICSSWGCGFCAGLGKKAREKWRAEREQSHWEGFLAAACAQFCSAFPGQLFHRQCSHLNQFSFSLGLGHVIFPSSQTQVSL